MNKRIGFFWQENRYFPAFLRSDGIVIYFDDRNELVYDYDVFSSFSNNHLIGEFIYGKTLPLDKNIKVKGFLCDFPVNENGHLCDYLNTFSGKTVTVPEFLKNIVLKDLVCVKECYTGADEKDPESVDEYYMGIDENDNAVVLEAKQQDRFFDQQFFKHKYQRLTVLSSIVYGLTLDGKIVSSSSNEFEYSRKIIEMKSNDNHKIIEMRSNGNQMVLLDENGKVQCFGDVSKFSRHGVTIMDWCESLVDITDIEINETNVIAINANNPTNLVYKF